MITPLAHKLPLHQASSAQASLSQARHNMVESQIRTNKVINPDVIAAFAWVERERFVPDALAQVAYLDDDLPIDPGENPARYLLEPMVFARLVEAAAITPSDVVLDFGCGCGYGSAILSRLSHRVHAVDWQEKFITLAQANLARSGINSITPRLIKLPLPSDKMPEPENCLELEVMGKFDVILIEGAMAHIPRYLQNLLTPGGRLVVIERSHDRTGTGQAILIERIDSGRGSNAAVYSRRVLFDAAPPFLPEFLPARSFQF
ncbi:MAG: protein-L-isoaspartate O-methyltransferase [Candidatus Symbiobacter sp.]|nr:protein-L-isoaspartate O-methyltransferase [Candidatus Symbiobacter sp.]